MATIQSAVPTGQNVDSARKRRLIHVSGDAALLILLFSAAFSSPVLAGVAGALFVGLLLFAWFSLRQPERNAFVLRAVASGLIAGGIAAGIAMLSQ